MAHLGPRILMFILLAQLIRCYPHLRIISFQQSTVRMEDKLSAMGLKASLDYESEDEYSSDGKRDHFLKESIITVAAI